MSTLHTSSLSENKVQSKTVFILGSVLSGLGKGIVTCSIGAALQARGLKVHIIKIDPYLNLDAGTMNPTEHGETFVTNDGGELDVDFGHYERFLEIEVSKEQNITTGQIYFEVISRERRGDFLGQTVQIVPHIIDEILRRIEEQRKKFTPDVMLVEVGGTIGDIESQPYLEAIRQLKRKENGHLTSIVLLTYVPFPEHLKEHKTKPAQHSVRELQAAGMSPNIIICRSSIPLSSKALEKISNFGNVAENAVLDLPDLPNVFQVPRALERQGLGNLLEDQLRIHSRVTPPNWTKFVNLTQEIKSLKEKVKIGIPGKYTSLSDSYISVTEALKHAGWNQGVDVELHLLPTERFEEDEASLSLLDKVDGILIPGGFGTRGIEGKIKAIEYARKNKIPFLGICLGFQLSVVEYARNVLGIQDAYSTEINPNAKFPIIDLLPEQRSVSEKGGTMRLGSYEVTLRPNTKIYEIYKKLKIQERHRHRYEVNPELLYVFDEKSLQFTGTWNELMETLEIVDHPYFIATQFHPEFKSNPWRPSPPYFSFVEAALKRKNQKYLDRFD